MIEACETVWITTEHGQNPSEISCLGVPLSFQLSPALLSCFALSLVTSAGSVGSQLQALKQGLEVVFQLQHAWATPPSPHKQHLWPFCCPGQPEVKLCLQTHLSGSTFRHHLPTASTKKTFPCGLQGAPWAALCRQTREPGKLNCCSCRLLLSADHTNLKAKQRSDPKKGFQLGIRARVNFFWGRRGITGRCWQDI